MPVILPGETVDVRHVNLKLGPGLQQEDDEQGAIIITNRVGNLCNSTNKARWWVENSSAKRVCLGSIALLIDVD